MIDFITSNLVIILAIIGTLAFMVSLITEVTKDLPGLSKIPTDLQVIVLSVVVCVVAYLAYASYSGSSIVWYYIAATIIASFIVAFISMYGWEKLTVLWNRFQVTSTTVKNEGDKL